MTHFLKYIKSNPIFVFLADKLFILAATLTALLPLSPINKPFIERDSGVFHYIGGRILLGELPYRDVWDHKPPFTFYINALGEKLFADSFWGVWILEVLFLFFAAYLGYCIVKKQFGLKAAVFGTFFWLLVLFLLLGGGNYANEYALPFQFLCFFLITRIQKDNISASRILWMGICIGIMFFFKQTTIGIGISLGLYFFTEGLINKEWIRGMVNVLRLLGGFLIVCIAVFSFFAVQQAFSPFWETAFLYNFQNSLPHDPFSPLDLLNRLDILSKTGLLWAALIGAGLMSFTAIKEKRTFSNMDPLLLVAMIDLPVEVFLLSLYDHTYRHYFITILPTMMVFSSAAFYYLSQYIQKRWSSGRASFLLLCICLAVVSGINAQKYLDQIRTVRSIKPNIDMAVFIQNNTAPDDKILFWGAETAYNYAYQRTSPGKYPYLYPLYLDGYTTEEMVEAFLHELEKDPPKYIIDTLNPRTPMYEFPVSSDIVEREIQALKSQYQFDQKVDEWIVFRYVEPK